MYAPWFKISGADVYAVVCIVCIYRSLDGNYEQHGQLIIILLIIIIMLQWLVVFIAYVFIHREGSLYLYHHRSTYMLLLCSYVHNYYYKLVMMGCVWNIMKVLLVEPIVVIM